jgi:cation diffusion facilitator family transporter
VSAPDVEHPTRSAVLQRGLRLEYLTVGWNLAEGLIAVTAALVAGSVALLGFGIDSFVESASGLVLIWRLAAERRATDEQRIERVERLAERLVAASLVGVAAFIAVDAVWTLVRSERPKESVVGIVLTAVSLVVMRWLAAAKRRTALALGSRAMAADAFQTTACWWLSLVALGGLALNAAFGWWWADPVAALGMTYFILDEALEAWGGEGEDDRLVEDGPSQSPEEG